MNAQTSGVMAKSQGYQQVWLGGAPKPSPFAWIVALFAIVAQIHWCRTRNFCSTRTRALWSNYVGIEPLPYTNPDPLIFRAFSLASLVSIVIASSFVYRDIAKLLARNGAIIAYISWVVISAAWSLHPDLSLRRGLGCILTILVAAYLAVQF